jgi:hypothetical protein
MIKDPINKFPAWASWSWDKEHLPEMFHTRKGLSDLVSTLKTIPLENPTYGTLEYVALVIGLACRDMEATYSADEELLPDWVSNSSHGKKSLRQLLSNYPVFLTTETATIERCVSSQGFARQITNLIMTSPKKRKVPPRSATSQSAPTGSPRPS